MSFRDSPGTQEALLKSMLGRIEDLERNRVIPDGIRIVKLGSDLFAEDLITGRISPLGQSVEGLLPGPQVLSAATTVPGALIVGTVPEAVTEKTTSFSVTGDYLGQRMALFHGTTSSGPRIVMNDHGIPVYPDTKLQYGSAAMDAENMSLPTSAQSVTLTSTYSANVEHGRIWGFGVKGAHFYGSPTRSGFQSPGTVTLPPAYAPGAGWLVVYVVQTDPYGPDPAVGSSTIGVLSSTDVELFAGSTPADLVTKNGSWAAFYFYTTEAGTVTGNTVSLTGPVGCIASAHVLDTRVPEEPAE